jgi:hypothetical protein
MTTVMVTGLQEEEIRLLLLVKNNVRTAGGVVEELTEGPRE